VTVKSHYETFQARRSQLAELIRRARPGFLALDMNTWAENCGPLAQRVDNDRFRVMVLGEFKRGKSTFINALLHAEVLPAETTPCTAVINEVKWGDEKRAVLHFRQPLPERHPPLPPDARRHVSRNPSKAPPMDIPVADLSEFVKIPDPTANQAESVAESPYDRVEVYWPLQLCRNGVEIIDSPGLNEHHTRTRTTREYLPHIDAVIFVLSVHALASESELAVVDNDLRGGGHEYLFFVCNRFDELRKKEDRDKVQSYAYSRLAERTRFGREGVFFLSALDALEGRLGSGDAAMVSRSGILPLERALERFLVEERGRVKLHQPASQLARGVRSALTEVVPARRKLLDEGLDTLRARLDQARPEMEQAARRRDTVLKQVESARLRVRETVRREAERFFTDLAGDVPMWVRRMETSKINPWVVWALQDQADKVAREVLSGLQPAIEESMGQWERTRLRPLLEQQMAELNEALQLSIEPFLAYLDGVKGRLSGDLRPPRTDSQDMSLERLLTGTGGAVLGAGLVVASLPGIGAAVGAAGLTAVVGAIATKVGALLLSFVNPLTVGLAVVGVLALHRSREAALTDKVKTQVAEGVAAQLRQEARDKAAAIADGVHEQTATLASSIADGLEREIRQVHEQVEAIIRHKEEGEAEVRTKRADLDRVEAELRQVDEELNELMMSLRR
jgi:hypothetical protein